MNSGVATYIVAEAKVQNSFPVDFKGNVHISCSYCEYYSRTANKCYLTSEIIYKADSFTGNQCPLEPLE